MFLFVSKTTCFVDENIDIDGISLELRRIHVQEQPTETHVYMSMSSHPTTVNQLSLFEPAAPVELSFKAFNERRLSE